MEKKTLPELLSKLTTEQLKTLTRSEAASLLSDLKLLSASFRKKFAGESLPIFMKEILELSTPSHMMQWMSLLQKHKEMVVEASRDHGKSWLFSYAWPLFQIQKQGKENKKDFNIALISYSEEQARKNLARIRKQVESNPYLKWLMPASKAFVWEAGLLQFSNNCSIESFGFGSSLRGGHFDMVVVDDPTKDHWTISIAEQENFFYGVIVPATRKTGQLIVCGTPVEKNDLMERLEANKEFPHYKFPCLNDKNEPLWPEQYTVEDLNKKKRQMPPHLWMREFMLKRVSPNDAKFREEWIRYYEDEDLEHKSLYKIMTIDPALSPGGDALAAIVTGTTANGDVYVIDRMAFRGDFKTGVGLLCDLMGQHEPDYLGIETFAFQKMYAVWLEEEMNRRGLRFRVEELGRDNKKSKAARIEALQPKLAQGKLYFKHEHKPLIDQLLLWDPVSKHNEDDEIDALAWQVPLWQSPLEDDAEITAEPLPGTFNEAFEELRSRSDMSYISRMFSDMRLT